MIWGDEPAIAVNEPLALQVQYRNNDTSASNNRAKPGFRIINNTMRPVDLKDLKVRYWFTSDGESPLSFSADYVERLTDKVTSSFQTVSGVDSADHYLELGFTENAGLLHGLSNSGRIDTRITKTDWTALKELNDFSHRNFSPAADYLANARITLYYKGQLVFGQEPASVTTTMTANKFNNLSLGTDMLSSANVYPNPASSNLYLNLGEDSNVTQVMVLDAQGRKIQVPYDKNAGVLEINISQLTTGMYVLQVVTDAKVHHHKFLVDRK